MPMPSPTTRGSCFGPIWRIFDHTGSRSLVHSRAGDLAVAEDDVAQLKALLNNGVATAGDLGVDLARRLLLAGLAVVE